MNGVHPIAGSGGSGGPRMPPSGEGGGSPWYRVCVLLVTLPPPSACLVHCDLRGTPHVPQARGLAAEAAVEGRTGWKVKATRPLTVDMYLCGARSLCSRVSFANGPSKAGGALTDVRRCRVGFRGGLYGTPSPAPCVLQSNERKGSWNFGTFWWSGLHALHPGL